MIIPVWQTLGQSTHKLALHVADLYKCKATHTGTLDPMAEGVVVVLTEDDRFNKLIATDTLKAYDFSILLGISTDSYDGLGLILQNQITTPPVLPSAIELTELLKPLVGDYIQKVPLFSARKLNGKRLYTYQSFDNLPAPLPTKSGKISKINVKEIEIITLEKAINTVLSNVKKITYGDFRQNVVSAQWERFVAETSKQLLISNVTIINITAEVSKGIYVRSLSQDICKLLQTVGFVYSLVRTKNGEYTKNDCKMIY